jgi:excisionase family DNA binding protein
MIADAIRPTPDERSALVRLADLLGARSNAQLTLLQGATAADVPRSVRDLLLRITEVLASGRGLAVVPVDKELTTREAAELLGVSRPTLIKLLDDGEIEYSRPNSSRRIPLDEVLAYKERRSKRRRHSLDELTADAVDSGLYGAPSNASRRS